MKYRISPLKVLPLVIAIFAAMLFSGVRKAQEADLFADEQFDVVVSYNFKEAAIKDVLRLIAEQNDLNVVLSPSVTGTVTFRLSNVTLREAINVILEAAGLRIEKTDNIIRVYSNTEFEEKQREGLMVTEIFQVNYVDAGQLESILHDYMSKDGQVKKFQRMNLSASGGMNRGGNARRSSRGSPKEMLIFTDYPENLARIREMFDKLDSETRQVMIESRIVETTLTDTDVLGTDWSIGATLSGSPGEFDTRYGKKISYGSLNLGGFQAVYSRLMEDKNSNILSNAKLAVMDNERAHIHVGQVIPVGISTVSSGAGGSTNFGTTGVQQWEVGITLDVTPTVLENDILRIYISPQISTVVDFAEITGGQAPVTSNRGVQTQILIKSGETIVIGGLIQDQETVTNKKVPVLGDLPVIGSVFRKKGTAKTKTNLLIFITGTILDLKSEYQPDVLMSPTVRSEMDSEEADPASVDGEEILEIEETVEPEESEESMQKYLEYK